jgi:hypothetical protein
MQVSRCFAREHSAAVREAHPALFALADAPPPAEGAWVVSVEAGPAGAAALWWLSAAPITTLERATLVAEAPRAVEDARRLLRALPFGWSALPDQPLQLGRAVRFDANEGAPPPSTLDGRSLSGAAMLALSARYYGVKLPQNILASVDLDPATGRTLEVGGVKGKAAALRGMLPRLQTLYVAQSQTEAWQGALAEVGLRRVTVQGVESATELVAEVLRPADLLARLDTPAVERTFVHLRRVMLEAGMGAALSWPAVQSALSALRGRLPPTEGPTLTLLEGVVRRYRRDQPVEAPPDEVFDAALRLPSRRQRHIYLAHAIQWAAEAGVPLPTGVEAQVPLPDAGHLAHRARGAWARWLLVAGPGPTEGRAAAALQAHEQIVKALLRDDDLGELSSSLSVCLQLAGGLCDRAAFEWAEAHLRSLEAEVSAEPRDLAYLRIARARGAWALGGAPPTVVDELRALRRSISPTASAGPGPYAGLAFLDGAIYRTLRLLGHDAEAPPAGAMRRVQAFLELAEGTRSVDDTLAAEDDAYRAAARAVAGPSTDGEQLRRERLLKLYPY